MEPCRTEIFQQTLLNHVDFVCNANDTTVCDFNLLLLLLLLLSFTVQQREVSMWT